jgi:FtsZ-interacting cell division protein ZipA
LIIVILIIVIAILGIIISKRKKRKLEDLCIKDEPEEVLKPEEAYKQDLNMVTLAQASETTSDAQRPQPTMDQQQVTLPQQAIDTQPLSPTVAQPGLPTETPAVVTPTVVETPTIPSVVQSQLPSAHEQTILEPTTELEFKIATNEQPLPTVISDQSKPDESITDTEKKEENEPDKSKEINQ